MSRHTTHEGRTMKRYHTYRITLVTGNQRVRAISYHTSGGSALAEICEALDIVFPQSACVVRVA